VICQYLEVTTMATVPRILAAACLLCMVSLVGSSQPHKSQTATG
jgi:hypothetical protein